LKAKTIQKSYGTVFNHAEFELREFNVLHSEKHKRINANEKPNIPMMGAIPL
jgi:hypothetical protein